MVCCQSCEDQFDERHAADDLKTYRRDGPNPTTRTLLTFLRGQNLANMTLLDVGGGVGAIHHELLDAGVERATHVDASAAYLRVAREEAERRGHAARVEFHHGDFVDVAKRLAPVDIVTLDRVICCYPDMPSLVASAASRALRFVAAVFPRDRWFLRMGFPAHNCFKRLTRNPFRIYLHSPPDIESTLGRYGFERQSYAQTFVWSVCLYARTRG